MSDCVYPKCKPFVCAVCGHEWTRLDLLPFPPARNCTPAKPPRDLILDYLRAHPGSTIGEIVSSCTGCKDNLANAVWALAKSGEILKSGENPPVYAVNSEKI